MSDSQQPKEGVFVNEKHTFICFFMKNDKKCRIRMFENRFKLSQSIIKLFSKEETLMSLMNSYKCQAFGITHASA